MYPTKVPGFIHVATRDYIGALLAEGARAGVKIILYMPGGMGHWDTKGGPWVGECLRTPEGYGAGLRALVREMAARYETQIGGFWLDGLDGQLGDLPALMHKLLPDAVVMVNNHTRFNFPKMDVSTIEFLAEKPDPLYNRPAGLLRPIDWIGMMPPMKDFNEDIPTCNDWWHGALPYNDELCARYAGATLHWHLQGLSGNTYDFRTRKDHNDEAYTSTSLPRRGLLSRGLAAGTN